ncbi:MAG: glycosyltransferase family 4 protein [Planctomycetota bacterium]
MPAAANPAAPRSSAPRVLVISQVYVPDPASVGQHMADAAEELARRGYRVRVLTSRRGYDDPAKKYPAREDLNGVDVVRLPFSSLGKATILHRVVGQLSFLFQAIVRGLFTPGLRGMLVSTSPPMAAIAAIVIRLFRRAPITYWVMDLNPDQVIASGHMKPTALAVRALDWLNRRILNAAAEVVALDRFMADRLRAKLEHSPGRLAALEQKISTMPPWPMLTAQEEVPRDTNPFRQKQGWGDRRVIMYSGNHGLTTPVDTLVEAALRLRDDDRLVFAFIGGGAGKEVVDRAIAEHAPRNLVSLPYQPLSEIKYSLSSADVHVVLMNEALVGIVHPCKVYGAMSVSRPLLYFGPRPSHITELLDAGDIGWQGTQGDVDGAVAILQEIAARPLEQLAEQGRHAQRMLTERLSREALREAFCDVVVRGVNRAVDAEPAHG